MITIPIEIGDVILTGKFKNHKVTVQEIGTDDYGLPTVNGKGIMKIRVQKLMPQKTQESNMRKISEGPATNNPKVQKIVDEINKLITSAVDGDGDPIEVVDSSSTWAEPMVYEPVVYSNGRLKFTYREPMSGNRKKVYVVNSRDIQTEGIPMLRDLSKWYRKAMKQSGKPTRESRISESSNKPYAVFQEKDAKGNFVGLKIYYYEVPNTNKFLFKKVGKPHTGTIPKYASGATGEWVSRNGYGKNIETLKKYHKEDNIFQTNENKVKSKMKLSEVISKGVFINIKKEDGKFWFYIDTVDGPECISNVGFPTKEAAEHAALTKGFNVKKGGDAEDEMPETVEVPKPTKREKTPDTEKPKEIDLGKPKEIKLEESIKRLIRAEISRLTEKKKSLTEAVELNEKIEDALAQLKELQDKIASAKAEIDAVMKRTGLKDLEKKSDEILKDGLWDFFEELKQDEQRIVSFKNIVMTVKRFQASPATYEYEKVLDFAMTQVNQDVKAKILAELKASEKIGKTKGQVAFTTEGVGDIWNSVVNFLKGLIPALKSKGKKIDNDIAKAEAQLAKIQ